ncbi:NAD(FAD)-utilizing dehydrogenase [Rossellomorea aquimaris]|uniref:NAD(FAD)-utilizing dehydrogenase n=1 Tax=Rossellomorea aquimaris TaxID=189382 RepID=UPI001CD7B360|nr:NAD(FAD)-utilizing dehydrogenase [Rossellomorea aquimaris]MCA1053709.1 NAD(FAD)-utilizing dehydrogenase [Rossellomorea aquimaris]
MRANHHDITVIGAGVSSIFFAYTLMNKNQDVNIHIIDIGKELEKRTCGLEDGGKCTCGASCSKYTGFSGLGKSEGKFNYTTDFGGRLHKKIGEDHTLRLMQEVDTILCRFGGNARSKYSTKNEALSSKASLHGLDVLSTEVRHLGTHLSKGIFQSMYEVMRERITFSFETKVEAVTKNKEGFHLHTNKGDFTTGRIVIGTGMSGSDWLTGMMGSFGVHPGNTRLDMGFRVEMKGDQLQAILQETFETKLRIHRRNFEATTYCMNPRGRIIRKYQHGLVMPDGQNALEEDSPSANLNFTLFVPRYYPSYEEAMNDAKKVIGGINGGRDRIVVQKWEDFKRGAPTETLSHNQVKPSLQADCGDARREVPSVYGAALIEFLHALEGLVGEEIDSDTLIYGLDAKFYEPSLYTDESFESEVPGIYLIGDCSGVTHSLSQAAASGIYLGETLASATLYHNLGKE